MKEYLDMHGISVKSLSERTGISYSTLNDIVNGKTRADNIRFRFVKLIARELNLSRDDFNSMFCNEAPGLDNGRGTIITKNKSYYLVCDLHPEPVYLCKANGINSRYIRDIAKYEYDAIARKDALKGWKTKLSI